MQKIRTTITLPEVLHEELKLLAVKKRKSLSDVIIEKITGKETAGDNNSEKEVERTLSFFRQISREGKQIDAVKAIRELRRKRIKNLSEI